MHEHGKMSDEITQLKDSLLRESDSYKKAVAPFMKLSEKMKQRFDHYEKMCSARESEFTLEQKGEILCEIRTLTREFQAALKMLRVYTESIKRDLEANKDIIGRGRTLCMKIMDEFNIEDDGLHVYDLNFKKKWYETWK